MQIFLQAGKRAPSDHDYFKSMFQFMTAGVSGYISVLWLQVPDILVDYFLLFQYLRMFNMYFGQCPQHVDGETLPV
jgi:hypothetical protein